MATMGEDSMCHDRWGESVPEVSEASFNDTFAMIMCIDFLWTSSKAEKINDANYIHIFFV